VGVAKDIEIARSLFAKKLKLALLLVKNKELLNDASFKGQSFTPKFISNEKWLKTIDLVKEGVKRRSR
jgi:hypothetical protein